MNNDRQIFVLRIRALPGVDAIRALRFVLKSLLRRYGFRCLDVRAEKPQTEKEKD